MKKITFILIFLSIVGCRNSNEKAVSDLIAQNNRYYQRRLQEYKVEEEMGQQDNPHAYDKVYHQNVYNAMKAIGNLKDNTTYDTIFEALKKLSYQNMVKKTIEPIQSEDNEVLKNNLYVLLMNAIEAHKLNRRIGISTHCMLSDKFKIRRNVEKDSVILDFYTFNPYQMDVKYIVDGNDTLYDGNYKSERAYKVWSIRYKPKSKNSSCHGRIFYGEDFFTDVLFVQDFDVKIAK